uniref:Uncharacterized protein n=1 Tax=Oryza sativa subsp. japonica TaxID=39947 RepID=Q5Z9D0_ORYSJ|nr:hypothetical protein [Oryza sativa Japonica Group]
MHCKGREPMVILIHSPTPSPPALSPTSIASLSLARPSCLLSDAIPPAPVPPSSPLFRAAAPPPLSDGAGGYNNGNGNGGQIRQWQRLPYADQAMALLRRADLAVAATSR